MYLSGHPIDEYEDYIKSVKCDLIGDILDREDARYNDRDDVHIVAIVSKVKNQITKSGAMMAFVTVEDRYGVIEVIAFPNVYAKCGSKLGQGSVVEIFGTVSLREDEDPKIIVNEARFVDKNSLPKQVAKPRSDKPLRLYLRLDNLDGELYRRAFQVLDIFEGRTPVVFYLTDNKKSFIAPEKMWVSLNDVMINELRRRLGDENVVMK